MKTWQEPPAATQPGRIVRLLRRPEGATFREIADRLKVRTANARTYLSTMRAHGCPVQEREEEGRGRVFYLIKVDRRRKAPEEPLVIDTPTMRFYEAPDSPLRDQALRILQDHDSDRPRVGLSHTDRAFLIAAAELCLCNPVIEAGIVAEMIRQAD